MSEILRRGFSFGLFMFANLEMNWGRSSLDFPVLQSNVRAKSLQSCLTLCNSVDCSPPGSSVRGILQARLLEWVAKPSSRGSSRPRGGTHVSCGPCTASGFFTAELLGKPWYSINIIYFFVLMPEFHCL